MNRIDARRFAAERRQLSGTSRLSAWPRAAESVIDPSAQLEYRLQGGTDESGRPQLQLELSGVVDVTCQRCLQPMRLQIGEAGLRTNVLLAANEQEQDEWDAEVEDAEVVLADQPLDIDELLEDEFLLSLPFSPMCDDPGCPGRKQVQALESAVQSGLDSGDEVVAGKSNPFAALRGKLDPSQN